MSPSIMLIVSTHACQITSAHITSGQISWCQLLPHQVRSAYVSLYHIRSDQLMSAYITSGQISWCQLISYKVRPADVSLYHIKSDQLMSAYNTSGQITWLSAYITSSTINWCQLISHQGKSPYGAKLPQPIKWMHILSPLEQVTKKRLLTISILSSFSLYLLHGPTSSTTIF